MSFFFFEKKTKKDSKNLLEAQKIRRYYNISHCFGESIGIPLQDELFVDSNLRQYTKQQNQRQIHHKDSSRFEVFH